MCYFMIICKLQNTLHGISQFLVPYLVGMCHDEGALLREVVVEVGDDLDGHISLSSTRRTHNLLVYKESNEEEKFEI